MFPLFKKDEPAKVRFIFDGKQVTLDDIIYIEHIQQGKLSAEELKLLMCHFLVDADGNYMSEEKAAKILGKLKKQELTEAQTKFVEAITEASIPKANGTSLNSPSEAGQAVPSPTGSTP